MKKNISIEKKFQFPTMIGEITAISLENNLKFINDSNIGGELLLLGKYKLTEASRIEEDFNYKIPTEITLLESTNPNNSKIDITDFYYEIENNDTLVSHIELEVEIEDKEVEILEETRECDGNIEEKEIEIPIKEESEEEKEETSKLEKEEITTVEKEIEVEDTTNIEEIKEDSKSNNNQLLFNIDDSEETFGTFIVYIIRENENINTIIEKYHTSIEELEKYNNLKEINNNTKLIIPVSND